MEARVKKSIGDHLKQVAAYGILITFLSLGLGLGALYWSSTVARLNFELTQSRNELTKMTAELNKAVGELSEVKAEYLSYRLTHGQSRPVASVPTESMPSVGSVGTPQSKQGDPSIEKKKIDSGQSAQFFDNDLTISLVATSYEGDPGRYIVTANVSSENGKVVSMEDKEIGTVLEYQGARKYRITILEAGTFSATFRVNVKK